MAAILRGAIHTRNVGHTGNFPIEPLRDDYRQSKNLPPLDTQHDLLEAIALQIVEQLSLDNGPYLPQDSMDGIRATVWRAHKAQIRAAVTAKANKVEECLTTMGLAELIDQLLNKASWEEITSTIRDDIELQVCSKFNNQCLAEENRAYNAMIKEATKEGKAKAVAEALQAYTNESNKLHTQKECQAQRDADSYYLNLVEKAKDQACIKADSEFARLLADEHSTLAPRVDAEITAEHAKLVEEHRHVMVAQLNALTLEEEKKLVLSAAACLGINIQDNQPAAKKVKVDQRKARPAPITPRGRANSNASNSSAVSTLCKCAYSPAEVIVPPLPDRDDQKMPTPPQEVKNTTTITFMIKPEPTPPALFVTPSTLSVINKVVNLAEDLMLSPSLCGSSLSIHNKANHMTIDPETLNPADIFPPGIPLPPTNVSLPPAMSCTPQFRGAEAHEDGVAPSCSPEVMAMDTFETQMLAMMAKFNQPIWDTIHRIEQALGGDRIPRIPQHAGPGYWSEHIKPTAPQVSSASVGPAVTTQDTRSQQDTQVAPPFPSEPLVPEQSLPRQEPVARVDDEQFPELEPISRGVRCKCNTARAILQQRHSVPGASGPDNGCIPLSNNNSRIKPLFANVITQATVAQQQSVQHSAAQAHNIQGCKPSGNQGTRKSPSDSNLTEVTVI
jgi:hypothetical protein